MPEAESGPEIKNVTVNEKNIALYWSYVFNANFNIILKG